MGLLDSIKKLFRGEEKEEQSSVKSDLPAAASRAVKARLEALHELRDKGVISTKEFDRQQADMLKSL